MTHPRYLKEKAVALRAERRLTIDEIAERLALPRTTVYAWVRDLPVFIPRSGGRGGWPESARRKGNAAVRAKYRRLREDAYALGVGEWDSLAAQAGFRDFVCLYIAEGYKRSRNEVQICNSDAAVMKLADRWIRTLTTRKPDYRIQFHADQDVEALAAYWGAQLGIPPSLVKFQRKSNSNQLAGRSWRSAHGVLTVRVGDTYLRARLQAWMDILRAQWG